MANLTTAIVATAIIGMAAPGVARMATQPMIAQQRASNFAVAESKVVQFSAINEGNEAVDMATFDKDNCELKEPEARAYTVRCWEGEGQFYMEAERAFRLEVNNNTFTNPQRQFAWSAPLNHSHHQCHANDPWGVIWYNEHLAAGHLKACIPAAAWSQERYEASDPDDWLWDLSNYGFGVHPDY